MKGENIRIIKSNIKNKMKKIVIFYASYGGGHLSAAKSIEEYINRNEPDCKTYLIDCVKSISKPINSLTTTSYKWMAKNSPKLWGNIYDNSQKGFLGKVSTATNCFLASRLFRLLSDIQPDLVISTHPFGSQMTSYLKEKNKINCKLACILTDFEPHDQWLVGKDYIDYFFVAHREMKYSLINKQIDESKVFDTGIPISSRFLEKYSKKEIYHKLQLDLNKKVILFFGGGEFGLGKKRTLQILKTLLKYINEYQIVAISGRNKKMKKKFEEFVTPNNHQSLKIFEFTNYVPELMSISSFVITKPGGLTSSESLASALPIIVINPLPGQEEANALFLEKSGAAIWLKQTDNIEETFSGIMQSPSKLEEMKSFSRKISKPESTKNICKILLA